MSEPSALSRLDPTTRDFVIAVVREQLDLRARIEAAALAHDQYDVIRAALANMHCTEAERHAVGLLQQLRSLIAVRREPPLAPAYPIILAAVEDLVDVALNPAFPAHAIEWLFERAAELPTVLHLDAIPSSPPSLTTGE